MTLVMMRVTTPVVGLRLRILRTTFLTTWGLGFFPKVLSITLVTSLVNTFLGSFLVGAVRGRGMIKPLAKPGLTAGFFVLAATAFLCASPVNIG